MTEYRPAPGGRPVPNANRGLSWNKHPLFWELIQALHRKTLKGEVGRIPSPWERRTEHGIWAGISRTSQAVLFSPKSFFKHTAVEGGLKEPLAFGLLTGSAGMMFEIFWQFLLFGEIGDTLSSLVDTLWGSDATILLSLGIMALCPLLVLITILITSAILHRASCLGARREERVRSDLQGCILFTIGTTLGIDPYRGKSHRCRCGSLLFR